AMLDCIYIVWKIILWDCFPLLSDSNASADNTPADLQALLRPAVHSSRLLLLECLLCCFSCGFNRVVNLERMPVEREELGLRLLTHLPVSFDSIKHRTPCLAIGIHSGAD